MLWQIYCINVLFERKKNVIHLTWMDVGTCICFLRSLIYKNIHKRSLWLNIFNYTHNAVIYYIEQNGVNWVDCLKRKNFVYHLSFIDNMQCSMSLQNILARCRIRFLCVLLNGRKHVIAHLNRRWLWVSVYTVKSEYSYNL